MGSVFLLWLDLHKHYMWSWNLLSSFKYFIRLLLHLTKIKGLVILQPYGKINLIFMQLRVNKKYR